MNRPLSRFVTRFRCTHCGKLTTGRMPRAKGEIGDGTARFPRRHKLAGKSCPGNIREAEWVDVPAPSPKTSKRRRRP